MKTHPKRLTKNLPKYIFDTYLYDQYFMFGVDFGELKKIVDTCTKEEKVTFKVTDKIEVIFTSEFTTRKFVSPLGEPLSNEQYKLPILPWLISITIDTTSWEKIIKDSYMIGDTIRFEIGNDELIAISVSDENNSQIYEYRLPLCFYDILESFDYLSSMFNLTYLMDIRGIPSSLRLKLGDNIPLALEYTIHETEFIYILSPK